MKKTINGAETFIRKRNVNSKVILLHIGSNDLNRNQPHDALENYEERLINTCKECIPDAQIVVRGILQRFQRNLDWRDTYEGKRKQFNRELKLLDEKSGRVFSEAPYLKEYNVYDGVIDETGLPKLVSAYKRTTNNLLGIKRNQNNQS